MIASTRHPMVSAIRALRAAQARRAGLCVVEGPHLVREALTAGLSLAAAAWTPQFATRDEGAACVRELLDAPSPAGPAVPGLEPPRTAVASHVFAAISELRAPQGVLAVAVLPPVGGGAWHALGGAVLGLALDGVQDPGNVGNLARALAAFGGARAPLVVGAGTADPYGGKALRASAGAVFRLAVHHEGDLPTALRTAQGAGWQWWALDAHGGPPLDAFRPSAPCGFVVGSEGSGLSPAVRAVCRPVTIVTSGAVESLGAAQAGTLALYAAHRALCPAGGTGAPSVGPAATARP